MFQTADEIRKKDSVILRLKIDKRNKRPPLALENEISVLGANSSIYGNQKLTHFPSNSGTHFFASSSFRAAMYIPRVTTHVNMPCHTLIYRFSQG